MLYSLVVYGEWSVSIAFATIPFVVLCHGVSRLDTACVALLECIDLVAIVPLLLQF